MKVLTLSALRTAGDGTINLQDATQQNKCFSTYTNLFVFGSKVSYHNMNFNPFSFH